MSLSAILIFVVRQHLSEKQDEGIIQEKKKIQSKFKKADVHIESFVVHPYQYAKKVKGGYSGIPLCFTVFFSTICSPAVLRLLSIFT